MAPCGAVLTEEPQGRSFLPHGTARAARPWRHKWVQQQCSHGSGVKAPLCKALQQLSGPATDFGKAPRLLPAKGRKLLGPYGQGA